MAYAMPGMAAMPPSQYMGMPGMPGMPMPGGPQMPQAQYMPSGPAMPPAQFMPSVYPTASYTPVAAPTTIVAEEVVAGTSTPVPAAVVETTAGSPANASSYIAPATYAPTVYLKESGGGGGSYPAPYGPSSYTPAPSAAYLPPAASYQPPPMYGGSPSYTPAPGGEMMVASGSAPPLVSTTTTYPPGMAPPQYSSQVVSGMSPQSGQGGPGSYVAAPGPPPPKLTEGLPDPKSVESQKQAYSQSIEAQLRQETGALAQRNQAQKQSLAQMVQQQKAQYNLQMDQYLQQQAMAVDQQANAEMMMLQEAAMAQKMALEQQAAGLTLEYQQRKAQEEMMAREYQIQKQYYDAEQKLSQQYQKHHGIDGRAAGIGTDGRLSQQQLAMGHQAINSMAGQQMSQYGPAQPPPQYGNPGTYFGSAMGAQLGSPPMSMMQAAPATQSAVAPG